MQEQLKELISEYMSSCDLAEFLEFNGVITLPYGVKPGDKIYYPNFDGDGNTWQIDEDVVTDVCTKGIYVSDIVGADNNGCLILWDEIGETVFLSMDKAESVLRRNQEVARRKEAEE